VPIDYMTPPQRMERVVEIAEAEVGATPAKVAEIVAAAAATDYQRKPLETNDPFYSFHEREHPEPKGCGITLGNLNHYLA